MKTCELCGIEIDTKDGENHCEACDKAESRKAHARASRKARVDVLRSLGLTRVRGSLGGTYWE